MCGVVAESWSKPYRQEQDFLVESIQAAMSWFVRQRRREVRSVQRGSRRGQGSGIKGWLECTCISRFNIVLSIQTSTFLLLESVLYRVPGQLCIGLHAHLFENPCTVGADRRDAQVHRVCDLADGFSRADEAQHLVFPIRKQLVKVLLDAGLDCEGEGLPQRMAHIFAAPVH